MFPGKHHEAVPLAELIHALELPDQVLSLLVAHARAVQGSADRLGLVAERTLEQILARHTADSLLFALARRPVAGERWIDAGSGAGFPGLVLACAFPASAFTLVEPQHRRAGFLELQVLTLGLANVEVAPVRLERFAVRGADVLVARALEKPSRTFPLLTRFLRPGGVVLIAAGPATPVPEGAAVLHGLAPGAVDSPGVVLMMTVPDEPKHTD